MTTTKQFFALIGLLLIVGVVYAIWKAAVGPTPISNTDNGTNQVVCTADAMQCADGSWVGRTGPNCQFVCPNTTSSSTEKQEATVEAKMNQKVSLLSSSLTPTAIVEDSRCPKSVQCIQAGTVRVKAVLESANGTSVQTFTLNTPVTTESETITLIAVSPERETPGTISAAEYRFTFKVSKR